MQALWPANLWDVIEVVQGSVVGAGMVLLHVVELHKEALQSSEEVFAHGVPEQHTSISGIHGTLPMHGTGVLYSPHVHHVLKDLQLLAFVCKYTAWWYVIVAVVNGYQAKLGADVSSCLRYL